MGEGAGRSLESSLLTAHLVAKWEVESPGSYVERSGKLGGKRVDLWPGATRRVPYPWRRKPGGAERVSTTFG